MAASCQNEHSKHGRELPDLARAAVAGPAGCDGPSEGAPGMPWGEGPNNGAVSAQIRFVLQIFRIRGIQGAGEF